MDLAPAVLISTISALSALVATWTCLIFVDRVNHCVNATYTWEQAHSYVSPASADGTTIPNFLAGHADWRLPTVVELKSIADDTAPGCSQGSPCIDPIFGPTVAHYYWSATTSASNPSFAWNVQFFAGGVSVDPKSYGYPVRAVRAGL